jgi:hypothetical protein
VLDLFRTCHAANKPLHFRSRFRILIFSGAAAAITIGGNLLSMKRWSNFG